MFLSLSGGGLEANIMLPFNDIFILLVVQRMLIVGNHYYLPFDGDDLTATSIK